MTNPKSLYEKILHAEKESTIQEIVNKENVTAQDLNAANAVLKTVMPAVTAVNDKASTAPQIDRKARASKYIN